MGYKNAKFNILSYLLIIIGVLLTLYPFFSYLYSSYEQKELQSKILQQDSNNIKHQDVFRKETAKIDASQNKPKIQEEITLTKSESHGKLATENDFPGALLEISAMNLSVAVVKGTSADALKRGPGWYEESALPGKGNTAIAGHRNCYGSWFRKLDILKSGDLINLTFDNVQYIYEVEKNFVVSKYDWSIVEPCGYNALTLTTCHPIGSIEKRLIVRASLKNMIKRSDN